MTELWSVVSAFARTRWLAHRLKSRDDTAAWQQRNLLLWRARVSDIPAFQALANKAVSAWPVMDKRALMADFVGFNRVGITADQGWDILEGRAAPPKGYSVGASTGTSGNRGLYVISESERFEWLGVMLAKTLPRFPLETARIALALPLASALYSSVNKTRRLKLRFFDLHQGIDSIAPDIAKYRPDTLIAPPKVLRALAERGADLSLKRVFSGAEVLDPCDRAIIEAQFGARVREIYMATEGLLGVACEYGTLHLCEDAVLFEWEKQPGSDLLSPVITDFTRTTQLMVRYRLNDLIRLSSEPCTCGSPLQAVAAVEGRRDDCFLLRHASGKRRLVTPDVVRNAVVDADRRIIDFRVHQTGLTDILLILAADLPEEAALKARSALKTLLNDLELCVEVRLEQQHLETGVRKLRRVERLWKEDICGC